jgi:HSP20 family protein
MGTLPRGIRFDDVTVPFAVSEAGHREGAHAKGRKMTLNDLVPWRNNRSLSNRMQDPFGSLQQEMNKLFESFWGGAEQRGSYPTAMNLHFPTLDVHETDKAFRVTAELPGLSEEEVEINLRDNTLVISGEKKVEREEKDESRHYSERSFGRFQRVIPFGAEIDADKVQANFHKGLLTIDLPKNAKAQEKTRKIPINGDKRQSRH